MAQTIRCLIISDTHNNDFPHITTRADVALHCGDMTVVGGLRHYSRALDQLRALDAELKLVIAGNHDVSLDPKWWAENMDEDEEYGDDPEEPARARRLFDAAGSHGVHLLDEGVHAFTLGDGRSLSVFASPYTPEFGGYAFSYPRGGDHFSEGAGAIPEGGVDIVMTHGPPLPVPMPPEGSRSAAYLLDVSRGGEHCGCPGLFGAVMRARPGLHCFGHIHEGHGVQSLTWSGGNEGEVFSLGELIKDTEMVHATEEGKTLLVNAAFKGYGDGPNNEPWVVDVKLGGHA